nr:T9SS type A sorting domain-containing protein [Chitinophagaceae bacterium]
AFHCDEVFMNLGQTSLGISSVIKSFQFTIDSVKSLFKVIAPTPFEVSKDGVNFSTQLTYDSTVNGILQQVYIRILPQQADKVYHKEIEFMQNNLLLPNKIKLLGTSLPDPSTVRLATWNMHWFGDPSNCNCDTALAKSNALQVMKTMDADIYCLQEVVSSTQIKDLAINLGPQFGYAVSTFGSFAQDTLDADYASTQKLAYIYNKNKVQNVGSFGLLASTYPNSSSSGSPYNCFSSGRFPFVLKLKLNLPNAQTDTLILANIHGKASSTLADYTRRECGAVFMTDSLNALFPNRKMAVIGDYNDFIEGSSVSGQTLSPYAYMFTNGFSGLTLPSWFAGQTSYVFSENYLIDNICVSNALKANYPDSSTFIFHDVQDIIDEYAYTTSDHLPVMTYFKLSYPLISQNQYPTTTRYEIINPTNGFLQVNNLHQEDVDVIIYDVQGKKVFQHKYKSMLTIEENLSTLKTGLYIIQFKDQYGEQSMKWLVQ